MRRARVYFGSKRQRRGVVYETHSESDEYEYLDESKDEEENTNTPVPDSGDSEEDDEEYEANYIDDLNNEFEGDLFNRDDGDYAESDEDKSVSDDAEYNENGTIGEGKDHRLLALVNFYCAESISEGFLQRMLHLMAVLYGESPPFSANQVMNVVTKAGRKGVKGVSYYCSRCGTEKNGKNSQCPNCPTSNINILDRLTFVKCDLKYQMTNQLIYHGREIIMAHQKIHQKEINFQSNDIRGYGKYIKSIESKADFDSQVINLLYSVFSDGAAFSKISRREVTPVLCRLEGLDMDSKKGGNVYNMISMVFCDGGVKKTFLEKFVEQSFSDLPSQIEVRVDGRIWTFRLVILSYLSDMKERLLLTRLPNWHQLTGCSQCLTTGQKKSHGITYVNPLPSIYKYFPPSSFVIDPFHIKGSGICKTIVNEVLKPNSWTNLKLVPGAITSIINSIEGIKAYTYDNVPLASLRKLSKTTGREMEKLSRLISGIVGFEGLSLRNDFNVLFIGFLYALTLQGTGVVNPGTIQEMLTTMYELHCLLEPDSLTIKFHNFYNHITLHEQDFGPIHTTEPFEREHKVLMNSVHHQTTSCENVILNKYICGQFYRTPLIQLSRSCSDETRISIFNSMKCSESKFPLVNAYNNLINVDQLTPLHRRITENLRFPDNSLFLKRCRVSSKMGNYVFSAQTYCASKTTSSSIVCFSGSKEHELCYGEIELIVKRTQEVDVIMREFLLQPMDILLGAMKNKGLHPIASKVLEISTNLPNIFSKIESYTYTVVPIEKILCPAVMVNISGNCYVTMER